MAKLVNALDFDSSIPLFKSEHRSQDLLSNKQIVIATRQGEQPYPLLLIYDRVYRKGVYNGRSLEKIDLSW